jgi:hypothetical protein
MLKSSASFAERNDRPSQLSKGVTSETGDGWADPLAARSIASEKLNRPIEVFFRMVIVFIGILLTENKRAHL